MFKAFILFIYVGLLRIRWLQLAKTWGHLREREPGGGGMSIMERGNLWAKMGVCSNLHKLSIAKFEC